MTYGGNVHATVDEISEFEGKLKQFIIDLSELKGGLSSTYSGLSVSWNDANAQKFQENWEEFIRKIDGIVENGDLMCNFLSNSVEHLQNYLDVSPEGLISGNFKSYREEYNFDE